MVTLPSRDMSRNHHVTNWPVLWICQNQLFGLFLMVCIYWSCWFILWYLVGWSWGYVTVTLPIGHGHVTITLPIFDILLTFSKPSANRQQICKVLLDHILMPYICIAKSHVNNPICKTHKFALISAQLGHYGSDNNVILIFKLV